MKSCLKEVPKRVATYKVDQDFWMVLVLDNSEGIEWSRK